MPVFIFYLPYIDLNQQIWSLICKLRIRINVPDNQNFNIETVYSLKLN